MNTYHIAFHLQTWCPVEDVASQRRSRRDVRSVPRGGPQRERDREVRVVVDHDRPWYALFGGAAVAVPEALRHIAHPGRRDLANTARADHLVEERVGDRPHQLEVVASLADDLVSRREGDQRLERDSHRHPGAVRNESLDGLGHRHHLVYCAIDSTYER